MLKETIKLFVPRELPASHILKSQAGIGSRNLRFFMIWIFLDPNYELLLSQISRSPPGPKAAAAPDDMYEESKTQN